MSSTRTLCFAVAPLALALAGCQGSSSAPPSEQQALKVEVLAPAPGDLTVSDLARGLGLEKAVNVEKAPVDAAWLLPRETTIANVPHRESARGYRMVVSARELALGVTVPVLVDKPAVRISPEGAVAIDPKALSIEDAVGHKFELGTGMEKIADAKAMKATGAFTPGTTGFMLRPEIARTNRVVFRYADAAKLAPTHKIMIEVMEPGTDTTLALAAVDTTFVVGNKVGFDLAWERTTAGSLGSFETSAWLKSPSGKVTPLTLATNAASAHGDALVDAADGRPGELWEVEVDGVAKLDDGRTVKRTVKTAFSVAQPTARVAQTTGGVGSGGDINVSFDVEVGSAGRYDVGVVVFGTTDDGKLVPAVASHSAKMLEPGKHSQTLVIKSGLLKEAGVHAPFEVRDVRLTDQSRLGLLHRQARALSFR